MGRGEAGKIMVFGMAIGVEVGVGVAVGEGISEKTMESSAVGVTARLARGKPAETRMWDTSIAGRPTRADVDRI